MGLYFNMFESFLHPWLLVTAWSGHMNNFMKNPKCQLLSPAISLFASAFDYSDKKAHPYYRVLLGGY